MIIVVLFDGKATLYRGESLDSVSSKLMRTDAQEQTGVEDWRRHSRRTITGGKRETWDGSDVHWQDGNVSGIETLTQVMSGTVHVSSCFLDDFAAGTLPTAVLRACLSDQGSCPGCGRRESSGMQIDACS